MRREGCVATGEAFATSEVSFNWVWVFITQRCSHHSYSSIPFASRVTCLVFAGINPATFHCHAIFRRHEDAFCNSPRPQPVPARSEAFEGRDIRLCIIDCLAKVGVCLGDATRFSSSSCQRWPYGTLCLPGSCCDCKCLGKPLKKTK